MCAGTALANSTTGLGLSGTGNAGILGLCFPAVASISSTSGKTLLENVFAHFDEPSRFFAFKLGRSSGQNNTGSSFTIGQLDSSITSDMTHLDFTPVSKAGSDTFNYWKLSLRSLTINSSTFQLSPSLIPGTQDPVAVLDTGTTLILGPSVDVEALWMFIGRGGATRKNPQTGNWEVKCDRGVILGFVLGDNGREYPVDPGDINWAEGGSGDGWCMGGIQANDGASFFSYWPLSTIPQVPLLG